MCPLEHFAHFFLHTRYCNDVAKFLFAVSPEYIALPRNFDIFCPFRGYRATLFVDGVIIPIQRPDHAGNAYFCGRNGKSRDSLNVQIICDVNGKVCWVVAGPPGACHDKIALEYSPTFMQYLN